MRFEDRDAELGAVMRSLLARANGEGACSNRVLLREVLAACEDELRRIDGRLRPTPHSGAAPYDPVLSMPSPCHAGDRKPAMLDIPTRSPLRRPTSPAVPLPVPAPHAPTAHSRRVGYLSQPAALPPVASPSPSPQMPQTAQARLHSLYRAPPRVLRVLSPDKPGVSGEYTLLGGLHNGEAVWGGGGQRRLYSTKAGYWMLTAAERGPDRDVGLVESAAPHGGAYPSDVVDWQAFDGVSWRPTAARVTSAAVPQPPEGRAHDLPPQAYSLPSRGYMG